MAHRNIELDERSDQILAELAESFEGDISVLHAHRSIEEWVDVCEEPQRESLLSQKRRSEQDFRDGRAVSWEKIKQQNGL